MKTSETNLRTTSADETRTTQERFEVVHTEADLKTALSIRPYKAEMTRVSKMMHAPKGQIFLIVKYKGEGKNYINRISCPTLGLTPQTKFDLYESLWRQIQQKYNL